ncbi:hypothetical protein AOE01nite_10390 [Acetobacter oeni]|uniref:Uncharacterized protein n=1 Tax=Acetobacter oeni TaxID=304077 RepID=A0A511XIP5_9PROT|nr:hypothetical protein AOE01nite_10390 [Acetobacter oeni]
MFPEARAGRRAEAVRTGHSSAVEEGVSRPSEEAVAACRHEAAADISRSSDCIYCQPDGPPDPMSPRLL